MRSGPRSPGPAPVAASDRFATCAAFLRLITNAARREPLLVLVDDAHWLDSPSAECLAYAARRLPDTRVVLLAAARPSEEGPLLGSSALERLDLSGLGREDARALGIHSRTELAALVARGELHDPSEGQGLGR
jgi:predicted ATPase